MNQSKDTLCVLIIAHNQFQETLQCIQRIIKADQVHNIVVVDNYSSDGLSEWLVGQNNINYILCDEKEEKYADIVNLVKKEFLQEAHLLVLSPEVEFLEDSLVAMLKCIVKNSQVAAISPHILSKEVLQRMRLKS